MSVLDDLLDLLLPAKCALCGQQPSPLCVSCLAKLNWQARPADRNHLAGFVVSDYEENERLLVKAFKENGQTALARYFAEPLANALTELLGSYPNAVLVPVPSVRENSIKRGYSPAQVLAKRINRAAGRQSRVVESLKFVRQISDQTQLDARARRQNLASSMVVKSTTSDCEVIIVDDVVTTGATLLEAARALEFAGARVVGFLAFSETILKTQTKT